MSDERRRFYEEQFRPGFLSGAPVEVGANADGYIYQLWLELARVLGSDPAAPRQIRGLLRAYGRPRWEVADTFFLEGDFAGGFAEWGRLIHELLYVNLAAAVGHPRLDATIVLRWSGFHITRHGVRGLDGVMDRLQEALDTFHDAHGHSIIEDYWSALTSTLVADETIAETVALDPAELDETGVRRLLAEAQKKESKPAAAFGGVRGVEVPIAWPLPWLEMHGRGRLLRLKSRQLVRSAENEHRAASGLPLAGQGWVSEMALFRSLQEAFPGETIVHQARPGWLGRQSLDIFFPERMVAVEYQGTQHSQPVEFFGGKVAFNEQQERDATKRALCAGAGCTLIEVFPGYSHVAVIGEVTAAIR